MSRIVHRVRQAGVYFVTSSTVERRSVFTNHACAKILLEQLLACRDRGLYKLHGFVIMPDHFHTLIAPGPEATLEKAMMMIKGGSAHRLKEEGIYRLPVWQKGFHDRWIRDVIEYEARIAYMASNPRARHLCEGPSDYPWSSATGKFKLDPSTFDDLRAPETFSAASTALIHPTAGRKTLSYGFVVGQGVKHSKNISTATIASTRLFGSSVSHGS